MQLNIIINEYSMNINIDEAFITSSMDSFARLDEKMDQGIKLGPDWVENPTLTQRCQSAADKLLAAIEGHNEKLAMLSAGYILYRLPNTKRVKIDTSGEPANTVFD